MQKKKKGGELEVCRGDRENERRRGRRGRGEGVEEELMGRKWSERDGGSLRREGRRGERSEGETEREKE